MVDLPTPDAFYREQLHLLVWSGFFTPSDLETYLEDLSYEEEAAPLLESLRKFAVSEFAAKRQVEQSWPASTDCDRLDAIFAQLTRDGILAMSNAGVTTSDAHSDAWELIGKAPKERYQGFCYYHSQDVERAVTGKPLFIGFDAAVDLVEAKQAVGDKVAAALRTGFEVEWNRDPETRMSITNIEWKRRTKWPVAQSAALQRGFLARLLGR